MILLLMNQVRTQAKKTEETEKSSDNQDLSDVFNDDDESDSYVTMLDATFTDSDEEEDDQIEKEEETQKSGCFGINPLFDQTSLNNKDFEKTEISSPKLMEDPLCKQITTNAVKATMDMDKQEIVNLKQIGDPEKLKNYEIFKHGGESGSVLQKSVHIFRKPRVEHQARLLKSKSEGNLNELVDNEPKPSVFKSINRGLMTRSKKQGIDPNRRSFHQSTQCLVSTGKEMRWQNEQKRQHLREEPTIKITRCKAFPYSMSQKGNL